MAAQVTLPRDILSMTILFENRLPKEVLEMKPILPKAGVTCEHYVTDRVYKKTFYNWEKEFQELEKTGHVFSEKDLLKARFINLPSDVRQEISCRIFGTPFRYYGTKKSIYLAAIACFKPNSFHLSCVYSQAAYNHESDEKYLSRHRTFLNTIREGKFK